MNSILIDKHQVQTTWIVTKGSKGLQMITHSQGELTYLSKVVVLKMKQKNVLIMFKLSYNQHKQKIKHNKIQLKQELWSPAYVNNGNLPHEKGGN